MSNAKVINVFEAMRKDLSGVVQFPLNEEGFEADWEHTRKLYRGCLAKLLKPASRQELIRQLVHLLAICEQCGLEPLDVLWDTSPTSKSFEQKFTAVHLDDEMFVHEGMKLPGVGNEFVVYWKAMPNLSTCSQILHQTNGHVDFTEVCNRIQASGKSFGELEKIAEFWADGFDRFRQSKGGSSQGDKRYRGLKRFLKSELGGESYTCNDVNSDTVLRFWAAHWHIDSFGLKLHKTTHLVIADFLEAYASELQNFAIDYSLPINEGLASEEDTLDSRSASTYEAWENLTAHSPNHIKLLMDVQWKVLNVISSLAPAAASLKHSAVLAHCGSKVNNNIGRVKDDSKVQSLLDELRNQGFDPNYRSTADKYQKAFLALEKGIWASAHILLSNHYPEGVFLLSELDPGVADYLEQLSRASHLNGQPEDPRWLVGEFYKRIESVSQFAPELDAALTRTCECWDKTTLQGFDKASLTQPELLEELADMAPDMYRALLHAQQGTKFFETLTAQEHVQSRDEAAFANILEQIYQTAPSVGDQNGD